MATSTARFRFEHRVYAWARGHVLQMCGQERAFFLGLRGDGSLRRAYFAHVGEPIDGARKATLAEAYEHWFLFAPYPEEGVGYIEWLELDRETVERWLGRALVAEDFLDVKQTGTRDRWPRSWRCIVG